MSTEIYLVVTKYEDNTLLVHDSGTKKECHDFVKEAVLEFPMDKNMYSILSQAKAKEYNQMG